MSRIFDALQRAESERSGIVFPPVTSVATELIEAAELLQSTQRVESEKQSESLPSPCRSCGSQVPVDKLFCPKCDSFQGSVATGECHDDESHAEPEHLAFPEPSVSWIRALWAQKARMPRWMAIALPVGLMLLVVLVFAIFRAHIVKPLAAPVRATGAARFEAKIGFPRKSTFRRV